VVAPGLRGCGLPGLSRRDPSGEPAGRLALGGCPELRYVIKTASQWTWKTAASWGSPGGRRTFSGADPDSEVRLAEVNGQDRQVGSRRED
jgi:hypothetical protein